MKKEKKYSRPPIEKPPKDHMLHESGLVVGTYTDLKVRIHQLEKEYPFVNKEEIENYLIQHSSLLPVLQEAKEQILSVFGENIKISLELHHDPEEGWDELFLVIRSPYSAEEALQLEKRLAEEWFLDRMESIQGRLNITEEPL